MTRIRPGNIVIFDHDDDNAEAGIAINYATVGEEIECDPICNQYSLQQTREYVKREFPARQRFVVRP